MLLSKDLSSWQAQKTTALWDFGTTWPVSANLRGSITWLKTTLWDSRPNPSSLQPFTLQVTNWQFRSLTRFGSTTSYTTSCAKSKVWILKMPRWLGTLEVANTSLQWRNNGFTFITHTRSNWLKSSNTGGSKPQRLYLQIMIEPLPLWVPVATSVNGKYQASSKLLRLRKKNGELPST